MFSRDIAAEDTGDFNLEHIYIKPTVFMVEVE